MITCKREDYSHGGGQEEECGWGQERDGRGKGRPAGGRGGEWGFEQVIKKIWRPEFHVLIALTEGIERERKRFSGYTRNTFGHTLDQTGPPYTYLRSKTNYTYL
jgi:hypothetical protein